jgi:hypothetical protein
MVMWMVMLVPLLMMLMALGLEQVETRTLRPGTGVRADGKKSRGRWAAHDPI